MKNKIKAILKRGKLLAVSAAIAVTSALTAVCACAEEAVTEGAATEQTDLLKTAGDTLISTFEGLIATMIPVIMGILASGIVVFGIIALIKLAKKIFGKVAG